MLIFFFSPRTLRVVRRTSPYPSRVRLHEAKGAFFESHPVSRAPYAVAIGAPPRPVVFLSLSLFPSFVRTLARSLGRSEVVGRPRATSRRAPRRADSPPSVFRDRAQRQRCRSVVTVCLSLSLFRSSYFSCCPVPFLARVSRLFGGGASTLVLRRRAASVERSSFPPRGPYLQLSRSHQPARSRCSAPFRPILRGSPTHERRNSLTQLDAPSVVGRVCRYGISFVRLACRGEKRQFTRVSFPRSRARVP